MLTRRIFFSTLVFFALTTGSLAQGKKSSGGGDSMERSHSIAGSYTANGRNPDGSSYEGRVNITQQGDRVEFGWAIGNQTYSGKGTIEDRVVTVDWGDATPVIYVVMPNGALHGTWADGTALERLAPN